LLAARDPLLGTRDREQAVKRNDDLVLTTGGPMAGSTDKRKQSLYFPEEMLKEIQEEANRQDRSLSWIVQKAWKIARPEIKKYPSVNEIPGEEDERGSQE
jgi:uncharacterized small protein (TIGR04563 family)